MCGIAGFVDLSQSLSQETLTTIASCMVTAIQYRGPDYQGVWVDEKQGIALAHQRLAIVDCSTQGSQPMYSFNRRYVMIYNGEIYNFKTVKQALIQSGEQFRGHSDTEVLVNAFSTWGIDKTLKKINGMFSAVLLDRKANQIYLIRDRLGQKPLYYGKQGDYFFFASELKALLQHPNFQANICRDAVASYTRLNYVPAPLSIYRDIFKVLPGHYLRLDLESKQLSNAVCYWDHRAIAERSQKNLFIGTEQEAINQLAALLKNAVELRMIADVPLGAFLSGGIDSSLIVSLMQSQASKPIKTFTIGFQETHFNEANEAKLVANHLATEHTELYVSPNEAREVIPHLPSIYDEPFSDVSQIPTYLVSQLARRDVTVVLSGDGGDEFFSGYNRHFWVPLLWRRFGYLPSILKKPILKLFERFPPSFYNRLPGIGQKNAGDKIYKLLAMLAHSSPVEMYMDLISSWKHPENVMLNGLDNTVAAYQSFFDTSSLDLMHKMMFLDASHYLADDILVKVDRASMAVSLEARAPLLDHRVVEFAWQLPLTHKATTRSGKQILKKILANYIPSSLIDRPKMGFGVPIGDWLRGPLKEWAFDLLNATTLKQQGFFNPATIEKKWREHQSGQRNWQYCLWNILMFQSWLEKHNAPQQRAATVRERHSCTAGIERLL